MFMLFTSEATLCNAEYHMPGEKLGVCSHLPVPPPRPLRKISCGSTGIKGCSVAMKQQGKNNKISSGKSSEESTQECTDKRAVLHI